MADETGDDTSENEPAEIGTAEVAAYAPPPGARGWLIEALGCLIPLAVVFGFVLLSLWGYRLVFGPGGPPVVEAGNIESLELSAGDGKAYAGRPCRVFAEWVAIETDAGTVLIPRERVQSLRVKPSR